MRVRGFALLLVLGLAPAAGCGAGRDAGPVDAIAVVDRADTGGVPVADATSPAAPFDGGGVGTSVTGQPSVVGCADGSREAFQDLETWPRIAGCGGGFQVAGLGGAPGNDPHCDRRGGNEGPNPSGAGCAVADLCASGWHVCRNGDEVASRSPTGCEGATTVARKFFLVLGGASTQGVCFPGADATNDLHGCGTLGQPEVAACHPLLRRMSFDDCMATVGTWWCGTTTDHLRETEIVTKPRPEMGGALCCLD